MRDGIIKAKIYNCVNWIMRFGACLIILQYVHPAVSEEISSLNLLPLNHNNLKGFQAKIRQRFCLIIHALILKRGLRYRQ